MDWSKMGKGIAQKANAVAKRYIEECGGGDSLDITMDLSATHIGGCPLDFDKLLNAPKIDLAHDINGISSNLDRNTGKLLNCFVPRCAV